MTRSILKWSALAITVSMALYLIFALYAQQAFVFAMLFLVLTASAVFVFVNKRMYAHRYIFPAIAGMTLFVIFPLMYTVGIGFTNYSASNLLSFERVQNNLMGRTFQSESVRYGYSLYDTDKGYVIYLEGKHQNLMSPPFSLEGDEIQPVPVLPAQQVPSGEPLQIRDIIKHRSALNELKLSTEDGRELSMASLRDFAAIQSLYAVSENDTLTNNRTGVTYFPNHDDGF